MEDVLLSMCPTDSIMKGEMTLKDVFKANAC